MRAAQGYWATGYEALEPRAELQKMFDTLVLE